MKPNYLQELTIRLANGVGKLPSEFREKQVSYICSQQMENGGFGGRQGGADLYYTGFALRSLAILGALEGQVAERAADFLRSRFDAKESVVDFLSLIYGGMLLENAGGINIFENAHPDWRENVANALNELRREDGGFAKTPKGKASSTYHTFLVAICLQLLEFPIENPEAIKTFLLSQADDEGGFREIRVQKRAGTNPTAAGIGTLKMLDQIDHEISEGAIDFVCDMQNEEGGLTANDRIPFADILSTFTGMVTLNDLDALDELDLGAVEKFCRSMQQPQGGFLAVAVDESVDVEYTFYGIGSLALIANLRD